jgi:hypothetical protein
MLIPASYHNARPLRVFQLCTDYAHLLLLVFIQLLLWLDEVVPLRTWPIMASCVRSWHNASASYAKNNTADACSNVYQAGLLNYRRCITARTLAPSLRNMYVSRIYRGLS